MTEAEKPIVRFWRLYPDADGVSRWRLSVMTRFEMKSIQPTAAPQWQGDKSRGDVSVMTTVLPVGWRGDWHENPAPQWIVPLSGRWWVEAMDGTRVELGPGELSLGEDQGCTPDAQGRRGHRAGTVGDQPAVLMTVQLHVAPVRRACSRK